MMLTTGTNLRRLGVSDLYKLHSNDPITVSVNKRSGGYQGCVVWTADPNPTVKSAWTPASADSTNDDASVVIDGTATAVAFLCTAITDPARPRKGVRVIIEDATVGRLNLHNRRQHNSGGHRLESAPVSVPSVLGTAALIFKAEDLSSLFLDTAGTQPALGVDGEEIARWDSVGSASLAVSEIAGDHHGTYRPSLGGVGLPGVEGASNVGGRDSHLTNATSGIAGTAGSSFFLIFHVDAISNDGVFFDWADVSGSDGWKVRMGGSQGQGRFNSSTTSVNSFYPDSENDIPPPYWITMTGIWLADETRFMAGSHAGSNTGGVVTQAISSSADFSLFNAIADNDPLNEQTQIGELYLWNAYELSVGDQAELDLYAQLKYDVGAPFGIGE